MKHFQPCFAGSRSKAFAIKVILKNLPYLVCCLLINDSLAAFDFVTIKVYAPSISPAFLLM